MMLDSLDNNLRQVMFVKSAQECMTQEDRIKFCEEYLKENKQNKTQECDFDLLTIRKMQYSPPNYADITNYEMKENMQKEMIGYLEKEGYFLFRQESDIILHRKIFHLQLRARKFNAN